MYENENTTGRDALIETICRRVGIRGRDELKDRGYFRRSDLIHLASWIDAHHTEGEYNEK